MDDGRICRCRHMAMCCLGARERRLCIPLSLKGSALRDERVDGSVICIGKSQVGTDILFFLPQNGKEFVQRDQVYREQKVCFSVEARIEAKTGMDLVIGRCQDWQTRRPTNHHDVLDAHHCSVPVACRFPIRFSSLPTSVHLSSSSAIQIQAIQIHPSKRRYWELACIGSSAKSYHLPPPPTHC